MMDRCPHCNESPQFVMGNRQAFCNTDGCPVVCWDMYDTPEGFEATATTVELNGKYVPQPGAEP